MHKTQAQRQGLKTAHVRSSAKVFEVSACANHDALRAHQCKAWAVVTRSAQAFGRPVSSARACWHSMLPSLWEAFCSCASL